MFEIIMGECSEKMVEMQENSIDAIVTDPPYGLAFMGKKWDYDVPGVATFEQMLRVLKPGGRLLCFAGTRTMHRMWCNIEDAGFTIEDTIAWMYGSGFPKHRSKLKPAHEPICVARKGPVSELNIDAGRVGDDERVGRWPPNVVLDEGAAAMLDAQTGVLTSGNMRANTPRRKKSPIYGEMPPTTGPKKVVGDSGGASRFFYCAKASRREKEAGLDGLPKLPGGSNAKGFTEDVARGLDRNRPVANPHPTVKPVNLMRWLVKLVTKPGEVVLDPFAGSGTTGIACVLEGIRFIGIEMDAAYAELAEARIKHWSLETEA